MSGTAAFVKTGQRCYALALLAITLIGNPARATPQPAAAVQVTPAVVYAQRDDRPLSFDVYSPHRPNGAAIVFINSGGYVSPACRFHATTATGDSRLLADAELTEACRQLQPQPLLEHGFTVFNLRHGSHPGATLPAIVADTRQALAAIQAAAPTYGVDPGRLGLWGASAGGHLALLLATTADADPAPTARPPLAVVAFFPPSDLESLITPRLQNRYPVFNLPDAQRRLLSPLHHVSVNDPPVLIIHGRHDTLVPISQSHQLQVRLQSAGVPVALIAMAAGHGFAGADSEQAMAHTLAWFRQYLLPPAPMP